MRLNILLTLIVAITFCGCASSALKTSSPNKSYLIELTDHVTPILESETRFNVFKGDNRIVDNAYFQGYDWYDQNLGSYYPQHKWIDESTLRFGRDVNGSEKSSDTLIVSNNSIKTVKYLRIQAGDILLIFEMPPHAANRYSVPDLGELPWVSAEGQFEDGQHVRPVGSGVNFLNTQRLKGSLSYCVSVIDDRLIIESPVFDGDNNLATNDNSNIPRNPNCDKRPQN
jgi:hypothetical protein